MMGKRCFAMLGGSGWQQQALGKGTFLLASRFGKTARTEKSKYSKCGTGDETDLDR